MQLENCLHKLLLYLAILQLSLASSLQRCEDPGIPSNGYRIGDSFNVGDIIQFGCNESYELIGEAYSTCQIKPGNKVDWSKDTPVCVVKYENRGRCGRVPKTGKHAVKLSISTKNVLVYSCANDKYTRESGDTIVQCVDKKWMGIPLICRHKATCREQVLPVYTYKEITGTQEGDTVKFFCAKGYILNGPNEVYCTSKGQWSHPWPSCQAVLCPLPVRPVNGRVSYSSTLYGSVATYSCNIGYTKNGTNTRTCNHSGMWFPAAPVCKAVDCGDLTNPENGRVEFVLTTYESLAKYYCNSGYNLVGTNTRTCQANGTWKDTAPSCTPVDCGTLSNPINGLVIIATTTFKSIVNYTCNEGWVLIGNKKRECLANKKWSGKIPSCVPFTAINCGGLSPPLHGDVTFISTYYTSQANYSCNPGYKLQGVKTRTCQSNSQWSETPPTCTIIDCHVPLTLPNGCTHVTTTTFNSLVTYTCNDGFTLVGQSERKCQHNSQWSGDQPTCVAACRPLSSPNNVTRIHYIDNTTRVGSTLQYICFPGYLILGNDKRICQANRTWSGLEQQCQPVDCGPLTPPTNGDVLVFNTTLAHPARYSCNFGFKISGQEFRVCTINGSWSGREPTCKVINCGPLSNPANGNVDFITTTFASRANYSCNFGYKLNGPLFRFCTDVGTWSGENPNCTLINCGDPGQPHNGFRSFNSTLLNGIVTYSCPGNLQLYGNKKRVCQSNGLWSGQVPSCGPINCGDPGKLANGQRFFSGTTVGQVVTYICNNGFQLKGNPSRLCKSNGQWSGTLPSCIDQRPRCPYIGPPDNGAQTLTGNVPGSLLTYTCNRGYKLVGNHIRHCKNTGYWNGSLPQCKKILSCSDPGVPDNGHRINHNLTIGSIVYYVCNDGYDLVGSTARRCQDNGEWTGSHVLCNPRNLSCVAENGHILDSVGRRCQCVNGQLVNCCRYRQDWLNLTNTQRSHYIQAVLNASSNPLYRPHYQNLMQLYYNSSNTPSQSLDSSDTQFLPWHRYYLQQFEDLLRMIDPTVYIPYWDWTLLPENPYQNPIFSPNTGVGNSSDPNTQCVNNGPFQQGEFSLSLISGGSCLKRIYRKGSLLTRTQLEDIILVEPASSFSRFFSFLTVPYLTVRCTVGGTICNLKTAPTDDPLHLTIVSFVDSVWSRWQSISPQHLQARYGTDTSILQLAGGFKVNDYHDTSSLPYNATVCYGEPANNIQERQGARQKRDVNFHCLSEEWMEDLGLSDSQKNTVLATCRLFYTYLFN